MSSVEKLSRRVGEAFYGRFKQVHRHQEEAIESILSGRNLVLSAGTGSGKTEAVIAPLINVHMQAATSSDSTTIIYIAPTKALVNDIYKRLDLPLQHIGLRVGVRHGDLDSLKQKNIPHILITTPESLDVLLFRKDAAVKTVKAVVIDEVHLFYNTQRGLQLSILLHRLESLNQIQLQFACLSATVVNLEHIRDFMFGSARGCDFVRAETRREIQNHIRVLDTSADFVRLITRQMSQPRTKLLIFANSRKECEHLAGLLREENSLRDAVFTHYSSLSNDVRQKVEYDFASYTSAVCISTSTLELGIDIGDIDMVILYGPPSNVESLLQRIGRSNRRSKKTNVTAFVPETSSHALREALSMCTLIWLAQAGIMPARLPYSLYGAVVQQSLSIVGAVDGSYTRIADIAAITNHLQHLPRTVIEEILADLASHGYLRPHGFKNQYGGAERLYQLIDYRLIYGNFPTSSRQLPVMNGGQTLGYIPIDNLLRLSRGDIIRFAGKLWQIQRSTPDEIRVNPSESIRPAVDIAYSGAGNRLSEFIVNNMWHFIHYGTFETLDVLQTTKNRLEDLISSIRQTLEFTEIAVVENFDFRTTAYITFAGIAINTAIGLLLNPNEFRANEFSVILPSNTIWRIPRDKAEFDRILPLLFSRLRDELEVTMYQKLLPARLEFQEHMQFWYCDKAIDEILERLECSQLRPVLRTNFQGFLP